MPEPSTPDPAIGRILERVRESLPATIERSVATTFADVPAYPASPSPTLRADLTAHTESVFEAVLSSVARGRTASRDDFPITAEHATRRVRAGIELSDFLQGFRIGQVSLWEAIVEAADPERATRDAAVDLAIQLMHVIEVGSTMAAEAYMEAQQADLAEGDRLSRDVIDDLLAGRDVVPGPKAQLVARSGLGGSTPFVVVAAQVVHPRVGDSRLREALSTVRSLLGAGERGIATMRQDDIVGLVPAKGDGHEIIVIFERALRILSARGLEMAVGVSTPHVGAAEVPVAHRESLLARGSLGDAPGVRPLSALGPLDYLTLVADETAPRLVPPRVRAFVEEDAAAGGTQIETLRQYAQCDLNAKVAAERLHVHVNTAYYRIDQVLERTGLDPRRFRDLQELLIAIRLLEAEGRD